jgi:hypothetical protein
MKKKCTCGTQIVGGLCSSWCDLVRPDETPPETERSALKHLDESYIWAVPRSVYNPGGQYSPPQFPQTLTFKPKPTLSAAGVADGTSADDRVCKCGNYIIKHKSVHVDAQAKAHFELGCF